MKDMNATVLVIKECTWSAVAHTCSIFRQQGVIGLHSLISSAFPMALVVKSYRTW